MQGWRTVQVCLLGAGVCGTAFGQAAAPATNAVGAVTKLDPQAFTLTLKTDAGPEVTIMLLPNTSYRRVAPGETNLQNAAAIALADIVIGDRVLARGPQAGAANLVVVMSQSEIAKKQAAERAEWERRGIAGVVTAAGADSLTVRSRTLAGAAEIVLTAAANTVVRRYAPDSVRFADATTAKWSDIRPGDQVRARGERSADGTKMAAEEVVGGTFKTIAALIVSINAAAGELRAADLESKKQVTVRVNADSGLRKLQPQAAQAIAARLRPELSATVAAPGARQAARPAADFQQILDRSPSITLADLKAGDAIVVSSTVGAAPDRITAITLVAGVEPILTKPGTKEMSLGAWNLDIDGGIGAP